MRVRAHRPAHPPTALARTSFMSNAVTMLELVVAVAARGATEAEVVATVATMVNSGVVRLCGNFRGQRFDLDVLR